MEKRLSDSDAALRSGETANDAVSAADCYLMQNVPNPVNGSTSIRYQLPDGTTKAEIAFYSTAGTLVKSVRLNAAERDGSISVSASDLPNGVFVYKLSANGVTIGSKKMVKQ